MNVSLTPEMEKWIQQKVSSGFYTSASEVIREALRELFHRETIESKKLGNLRESLETGCWAADRGELREWTPEVTEELKMLAKKRHQA
ncbi:MAG: type II toxin-antitoxin system ParD family antitoxin [Verrucomicrobia bacterium]|nr:type II toxin-antitoxin system ParD family antitoxin [Verrucomicrobiota bacterium]